MTDKNPTSTLQSLVDSATGAAQSAVGSLTGSGVDKQQGEGKYPTLPRRTFSVYERTDNIAEKKGMQQKISPHF